MSDINLSLYPYLWVYLLIIDFSELPKVKVMCSVYFDNSYITGHQ